MGKTVFLIGMMASGKTTVGRELARMTGWVLVDMDSEIEIQAGMKISEIFRLEGESGFRRREAEKMREMLGREHVIVSCGGGAPMTEENRGILRQGFVIQLGVTVHDVLMRTRNDRSRPLLQTSDKEKTIRELLQARGPIYDSVSSVIIEPSRANPKEKAERILAMPAVRQAMGLD